MENLKEKTAKGLFWGMLNSSSTQVLNVVIGILLGRMLSPDEWAPIGMIAIFSAIAGNLQSSGFSTAIINMKAQTIVIMTDFCFTAAKVLLLIKS